MIDLLRLTNDVFDDAALSDPKLRTFAHDHLHRLTQLDTRGTFAPLIAATSTAYSAYYGNLTSEATAEAIGEGNTIATRNARAAVLKKLATQRHLVSFSFGQNGSVYQEFFPQGINAYRKASLDDFSTLLKRYETAALAHLSPAEASQVQTLITAYTNARKDQLTTTSETDKQRTSRREHRKTLTLQLTRNVLIIASHFLDKPDAFDDFFDLSLLPKKRAKPKTQDHLGALPMDYFYQETERLTLRKLTEADICIWAEFFVDNPNARFIGLDLKKDNHELATIWLDRQFERYNTNQFGQLAAIEKATGNFVGLGGILTRELDNQPAFEISYSMLPAYWGKGYATELAMHMKRFGLENGVSDKFISIIHRENILSMNVALKNGMKKLRESSFQGMEVFIFGD